MLLSLVIFLPLLGVIAIALLRGMGPSVVKGIAFTISLLTFVVSIGLYTGFEETATDTAFQLVEKENWITDLGISYHIGIDGISLWLILLTTFLTPVCILAAWNSVEKGLNGFMMSLLALETGMLGVFCSLDLFLFFVFWEAMLIPMYFLIGIWGGERRIYATIKFVLYTMAGSALMLVGILALYFEHGSNLVTLIEAGGTFTHSNLLFLAFFIAFAIKVPLFPFHTWLPDAHVEAPTVGSVILAGVLLKMGTYGIIRFCLPLFPVAAADHAPWIVTLAVIGIIYGALVAMVQPDLKKLVAYSSVSHLGFVVLGLFSQSHEAIQGSVLQMVNHGLSTGALFLLVGMIYERRHSRMIVDFGGLAKRMPIFASIFLIVTLSSIGLPGLNGFVGEFMILLGSFVRGAFSKWYVVLATTGVILAAVYMLWMFQRVMFGKLDKTNESLPDLNSREIAVLVPILVFIVWIGVFPNTFLKPMESSVEKVATKVQVTRSTPAAVGQVNNPGETQKPLLKQNTEIRLSHEEEAQTK